MLKARPQVVTRPTAPSKGFAGSCYCGLVQYECHDLPKQIINCYCEVCRKQSGGPYMSYFIVPKDKFNWSSKTEDRHRQRKEIKSRTSETRTHCTSCRSPLCIEDLCLPKEIQIVRTSIDDPKPDEIPKIEEVTSIHVLNAPMWVEAPELNDEGLHKVFAKRDPGYAENFLEFVEKRTEEKRKSGLMGFKYRNKRV